MLLQVKPKESGTHKKTFKEQIASDEANKEYAVSILYFFLRISFLSDTFETKNLRGFVCFVHTNGVQQWCHNISSLYRT